MTIEDLRIYVDLIGAGTIIYWIYKYLYLYIKNRNKERQELLEFLLKNFPEMEKLFDEFENHRGKYFSPIEKLSHKPILVFNKNFTKHYPKQLKKFKNDVNKLLDRFSSLEGKNELDKLVEKVYKPEWIRKESELYNEWREKILYEDYNSILLKIFTTEDIKLTREQVIMRLEQELCMTKETANYIFNMLDGHILNKNWWSSIKEEKETYSYEEHSYRGRKHVIR